MAEGMKAALVTGGGQGIGKAIARRLLDGGWRVAIAEIDEEAGRETAAELSPAGEIIFFPCDVAEEEPVRAAVEGAVARFGGLSALVNNAGIGFEGPPEYLALDAWRRVIGVNLTGAFLCAKHAAAHLQAARGAIVNIASTRALMSEAHREAYSASKGGIVALTHSLAVSLGPGVRVNCISPGWIDTSEWKKKSRRGPARLTPEDHAQHPAGRVGRPEDVAALAAYLLSPEAGFITGANFVVDGGMTRKMIYAE